MDRDDINRLAEQAGFGGNLRRTNAVRIERFANLVRNHVLEEVAIKIQPEYEQWGYMEPWISPDEIRAMKSK
jgi:hypothetical protein